MSKENINNEDKAKALNQELIMRDKLFKIIKGDAINQLDDASDIKKLKMYLDMSIKRRDEEEDKKCTAAIKAESIKESLPIDEDQKKIFTDACCEFVYHYMLMLCHDIIIELKNDKLEKLKDESNI